MSERSFKETEFWSMDGWFCYSDDMFDIICWIYTICFRIGFGGWVKGTWRMDGDWKIKGDEAMINFQLVS